MSGQPISDPANDFVDENQHQGKRGKGQFCLGQKRVGVIDGKDGKGFDQ